jgi:hypothetical protein
MPIASTAVWEVRPTVGSDTNGGGFDPAIAGAGTDYSQQNSSNSSGNNISTTDGVGNGTTTWTSATGNFTSEITGNIIYLAGSGITADWYEATYINGTSVTLDRSPGSGTGATMNIGGALATVSQGFANAQNLGSVTLAPVYVKATGTYLVTSSLEPADNNEGPVAIIGYTTTRGDNGQFTWTTATNSVPLVNFSSGANVIFQNIAFTTTAGTVSDCITNDGSGGPIYGLACINCSMTGFRYGINGNYNLGPYEFTGLVIDSCLITGCTIGVNNSGSTIVLASLIYGNSSHGFYCTNPHSFGVFCERSVFYDNGGSGIFIDGGSTQFAAVINCACVSNTSDGLTVTGQAPGLPITMWNTILVSNGGFGFNVPGQGYGAGSIRNNAYYNNTSGAVSRPALSDAADITLTGSPFTNPSGGDFTLNSAAGAGGSCKAAAFPSSLP